MSVRREIVVIGTSWGGLSAVRTVLRGLAADFPLPVVLVQHRHRDSDHLLANLLQQCSGMPVRDVEDKMPILPRAIYVAPADYHLLVERGAFALSTDEPVRYSRPSIDVTMESVAAAYAHGVIGVILTGANADGAAGLKIIRSRGGAALIQDPATAQSPTMPAAALRSVPDAVVLPIDGIANGLVSLADAPVVPAPAGGER